MRLGDITMSSHSGASGPNMSASFNTSFSDISTGLFGDDSSTAQTGTKSEQRNLTATEQLKVDKEGILRLIENILSDTGGLADIFGAEQNAGVFKGSTAKQGTENLLAKIAGELALLTGEKVSTDTGTVTGESTSSTDTSSEGILGQVGKGLKNVTVEPISAVLGGIKNLFS